MVMERRKFGKIINKIQRLYDNRKVNPSIKNMLFIVNGENEKRDQDSLFQLMMVLSQYIKKPIWFELIEWWLKKDQEKYIIEDGDQVIELYDWEQFYRYLIKNDIMLGVNCDL